MSQEDYIDPLIALAPTPANLSRLAANQNHHEQISRVFTTAYLRAASTGDSDLLEWLLSTNRQQQTTPPDGQTTTTTSPILRQGQPRQWIELDARDEDGSPAIILAAAFGHAEAVRAIVDGLGDQVVDRRDAVGWTALHWAARNGDLTIVSYLLNHGASTSLVSFTDRLPSEHPSSTLPSHLHSRVSSSCSTSTYAGSDTRSLAPSDHDSASTTTTPRRHPKRRRRTRARGLRPYDLAKRDEQGETIREILRIAEQAKSSSSSTATTSNLNPHSRCNSQASIRSLRLAEIQSEADLAKSEAKKIIQLARLASKTLEIDPSLLGLEPDPATENKPTHHHPSLHTQQQQQQSQPTISGLMASFHEEWEQEQRAEEFEWEHCQPDQMLVCSLEELEGIFEAVIRTIEPRQARSDRSVPANVLFFCARFAAHMGPIELLEEVLLGAVDRIEEMIFARQENMANSTFWLFNAICLLYYIRREPLLKELTEPDIQLHLEDLVNEIYVFIIRDAERRLDKLIDSTILDFEPLPEMAVEFEPEGSWRFVRALTVKRNRTTSFRPSIPRFNTKDSTSSDSPALLPAKPPSSALNPPSLLSGHGPRTTSAPHHPSSPFSQPQPHRQHSSLSPSLKSPKLITDLLSSVLFVLQAYEIHGSVIVQIFSQIFYWLGCETFNRIISRRKYLCRSKAMQIKLNVTSIEEWALGNRLPSGVVRKHFEPLGQLLKWVECLSASGAQSFDQLIEIVCSLKTLNPAQLLKVSRDYRFEVDEPKLSEECRQYLVQTQQDWDRRRIQRVSELELVDQQHSSCPSSPSSPTKGTTEAKKDDGLAQAIAAIDRAFGGEDEEAYGRYEPPVAPECLGELLDSRQMLPFGLPSSTEVLLRFRKTVPFGSLKTYLIPDEPKPGKDDRAAQKTPRIPAPVASGSVVPIVPSHVLKRIDRCLFKASTAAT
ncbi:hypothetical protein PtA15_8A26 [Puccinia triticina]|uniref:Dilute domain-containing protein n=1 Tax=Puccinia triticina TaxID=208348 RepID=A0ABY7CTM3_9BASI|nr:uncharacterized protein PtA15_8A26 [Puccinia triticina]WAQ87125.1 hypothetical protein PtA15_8A26 [Puccinia triticina]WAR56985.1 hypothetical protein PtB15_8B29 [Puccinia triticina]